MTFTCDVCGKDRKGSPYRSGPEGIGVCFLCVKETERHNERALRAYDLHGGVDPHGDDYIGDTER